MSVIERVAVDDLPVEGEPLSQVQARRLADQIRLGLESIWELALRASQGRVWLRLGYASGEGYCTRELGTCRPPLDGSACAWGRPVARAHMLGSLHLSVKSRVVV